MRLSLLLSFLLACHPALAEEAGSDGKAGCLENPKLVSRLLITEPGIYENFLVDGKWEAGNRVKITAANVTLRNCEIRNATGNGIAIFADNVTIENCRIHHLLAGTFKDQKDAHGITGRWGKTIIRNCEIHHTSGDSVQFDPDRGSTGKAIIERCTFWTGPLPEDAAGFRKGETPGENAMDTKVPPDAKDRCVLVIRDSLFHGWRQPGQIGLLAALNLKEHISATVTGCVFRGNQVALRLRGPGEHGGALVTISGCSIDDGDTGIRIEDKLEGLRTDKIIFGKNLVREYHRPGG
ncbi:MAG: right-handed parallel beta-helix repeat-containing protein [Verrucomicrobiaceae bacterium]|nr:MAG: right-handed parallel beta-helix repeat-containing protein [Verrucomicrobiaceae bacterium]